MKIKAANPRDLCKQIKEVCAREFDQLSARPWNMHIPDKTLWWLTPSTAWPAYKYAKLYFDANLFTSSSLSCGLHVEKGLDPSVQFAYPSKKGSAYIMEKDWTWHSFLVDLENGNVSAALKEALAGQNIESILRIEIGYIPDPGSFNPYDEAFRNTWARYAFSYNDESESYHIFHGKDSSDVEADNTVRGLKDAQSLTQIADKLKSITLEGKWLWIDIWIGFCFSIHKGSKTETVISIEDLWERHLSHFSAWL